MEALNDEYFKMEEYKRIASGEDAPKYVHAEGGVDIFVDWKQGEGGIHSPSRHPIPTGTTLVRFGGFRDGAAKNRTPEQNADPSLRDQKHERASGPQYFAKQTAAGAWWLEWSAYKLIEMYADRIGESVAYAVREVCAVPPEWSDMSFVIQGTTRSPLLAWSGRGKKIRASSGAIDPLAKGKPLIDQLYIPGLSHPDLNKKAVLVHSHAPLDSKMAKKGARKDAEAKAAMHARIRAATRR